MESPKVSVIIPCYQPSDFLIRALRSVEAQTYPNIEVIIIDDGSSSPVAVDPSQYSFSIILQRQRNSGLSAARNAGIRLATGDYMKFLDADDELLPHCIEEQTRNCAPDKQSINVIGWTNQYEDTGTTHDIIPAFADPVDALLMVNIAAIHAYLFSSRMIKAGHGFDESLHEGCEDYDFVFRLAHAGATFSSLHQVGVVYYRRPDSMSAAKDNMTKSRADVWSRHALELIRNVTSDRRHCAALLASFAHMLDLTPDKHRPPLLQVQDQIVRHCASLCDAVAPDELSLIVDRLREHPLCNELVEIMGRHIPTVPVSFAIPGQAINDHRLYLAGVNVMIGDEHLCKILNFAKNNPGFALYGAGSIGKKLLRMLYLLGTAPSFIIDRNWEQYRELEGVQVVPPEDIGRHQIKAIIIASVFYRTEILTFLSTHYPSIVAM